jgi:hypothetical protein
MSAQATALVLSQAERGNDPLLEEVLLSGGNAAICAGNGSAELNQCGGGAIAVAWGADHFGRSAEQDSGRVAGWCRAAEPYVWFQAETVPF